MPRPSSHRPLGTGLLVLVLLLALPAAGAQAGRLIATGHDADEHCSGGTPAASPACHYLATVTRYVRNGAPSPKLPVLVLDNSGNLAGESLTAAGIPVEVVDPSSAAFKSLSITTSRYSALVVASDSTCGGCDLNQPGADGSVTPDSDAINARASDIHDFFNAGGGILALAGAENRDVYYKFLPLPVGAQPVSPPFTLTSLGKSLGLTNDDVNCCATHNSFARPASGSVLGVAESDSANLAETLVAEGRITGRRITAGGPSAGERGNAQTVSGTVCVKQPGSKRCVPLSTLRSIRVGSIIDARHGTVKLTVVANSSGKAGVGTFHGALFKFTQRFGSRIKIGGRKVRKVITDLTLLDGNAKACPGGGLLRAASGETARRRVVRYLQAKAHGNFNLVGKHASGLERGTTWRLTDTCNSTVVAVTSGSVLVTDRVRHRRVVVRAGHSYTARA